MPGLSPLRRDFNFCFRRFLLFGRRFVYFGQLGCNAVDALFKLGLGLEDGLQLGVAGGEMTVHLHILHAFKFYYLCAPTGNDWHHQGIEAG